MLYGDDNDADGDYIDNGVDDTGGGGLVVVVMTVMITVM